MLMRLPTAAEITAITEDKTYPVTFAWSRLEGRPRADNFDRSLKAEVRDALWMLTRQWQMGEFEGDDAGSPVTAKLCTTNVKVDKYISGDEEEQKFNPDFPFEAQVEQRPFPFSTVEHEISLDLRLVMGRRWMQILKQRNLWVATKDFFLKHYGIRKPDPTRAEDAGICAHAEAFQQYSAVAGRMIDGAKLYADIKFKKTPHYYDRVGFPLLLNKLDFQKAEDVFTEWFDKLFFQPTDPATDAWDPSRLEYRFAITAPSDEGEKRMHAEEYYHGHLDWYNLDVVGKTPGPSPEDGAPEPPPVPKLKKETMTVIPSPVLFEGMPNTRWWSFEDSRTNFNYIQADTTELSKLLMIEFGLVYGNDWMLIPFIADVATVTNIKGLVLTNSFNENFWIDPAGKDNVTDQSRCNMFVFKTDSDVPKPPDTSLLLLPTVHKIQEGKPAEEVVFIRDEMANMVWAIESIIPLPSGWPARGSEAAAEYHALLQKQLDDKLPPAALPEPVSDGEEEARISYKVMNSIPENWIPFIPTHVKNSNREIQLQRAAMPRILVNNPDEDPEKIRPRTVLLQHRRSEGKAYYIHEEEVPRSGISVTQSFQRARWNNGEVFVWFGVRKTTGRGEGSSGLGFDLIVNRPQKS